MAYDQMTTGAGAGGDMRDRITQALLDIQSPPPVTQMPQSPSMPSGGQLPAAAQPTGMPGAMPGGMPGMGGMPGSSPQPMFGGGMAGGMGQQPVPGMMPGMQGMQGAAGGVQQQPQAPAMGGQY